jgi:hypothetical protein
MRARAVRHCVVEVYLTRHAATVRPRTITTLRERLAHAVRAFGDVPLRDLERMSGDLATWQARLPERSSYGVVQACGRRSAPLFAGAT